MRESETGTARLQEAIAAFSAAFEVFTREDTPLEWASTQNNLGLTLGMLGDRESGTTRLEAAVAAFSAALEVFTRNRMPLEWAGTHTNLGIALWRLGERECGIECLDAAVDALSTALEVDGPHSSTASSRLEGLRTTIQERSR